MQVSAKTVAEDMFTTRDWSVGNALSSTTFTIHTVFDWMIAVGSKKKPQVVDLQNNNWIAQAHHLEQLLMSDNSCSDRWAYSQYYECTEELWGRLRK